MLLQVFDDGRLTDGKGRLVDFTNTIIIATSNLGSDIIQRNLSRRETGVEDPAKLREDLMQVVRSHFRPEFINRIDEIIIFQSLTKEEIRTIVELQLERVKRTAQGQGVTLEVDASLMDHLANEGYRPEFGARELRRLIRSELETELARGMLAGKVAEGARVVARWDEAEDRVLLDVKAPDAASTQSERETSEAEPASTG